MAIVPLKPVKSSAINGYGYDPENRVLAVQWKGGATHHYKDVSPADHAALEAAESKGSHLMQHIVPTFDQERVDAYAKTEDGGAA